MHSLSVLNGYATSRYEFTDGRPYQIVNITNLGTQAANVYQGSSFIHPVGISDVNIISAPSTYEYQINVANLVAAGANPSIVWDPYLNVNTSTSGNTFIAGNVAGNLRYEGVKSPRIYINSTDYYGNLVYTTTLTDNQGNSTVYSTNLWIKGYFGLTRSYNYTEDTEFTIVASVEDPVPNDANTIYTMVFTQNRTQELGRFILNGTPGSYDGNLTVTGTKNTVNAYTIKFDPAPDSTATILIDVSLTKAVSGNIIYQETKNLTAICSVDLGDISYPSSLSTYLAGYGVSSNIALDSYQITDGDSVGDRQYSLSLNLSDTTIGNIYVNDVIQGNYYAITGTKSVINSTLTHTQFVPSPTLKLGSGNIILNASRLSPNANVFATNVSSVISTIEPAYGSNWQGGWYIGQYNTNDGSIINPNIYLIGLNTFGTVIYGSVSSGTTTSRSDGLTATNSLMQYMGTNNTIWRRLYNFNHPYIDQSIVLDWYVPSEFELKLAYTRIPTKFTRSNHWSSTILSNQIQTPQLVYNDPPNPLNVVITDGSTSIGQASAGVLAYYSFVRRVNKPT